MVKPSQPKGIKPKAEISEDVSAPSSSGSDLSGQKFLIINTIITTLIAGVFIVGNYFTVNSIVDAKLKNLPSLAAHNEEAEKEDTSHQRGIILDLGEFILNLNNPAAKRYLKINVALELTRAPHDPPLHKEDDSGGGHGGHGGHGKKAADPLETIKAEMNQYKPAIRDAIISILSSKTAEELSSLAGKELAKEQIKEAINPIFAGEREVKRVSFGAFIIQ